MPHQHTFRRPGFTLIELLIVVVIIGLLTGIATTSYLKAQSNARDDARKADLHAIATAVETYYAATKQFPGLLTRPPSLDLSEVDTFNNSHNGCLFFDNTSSVRNPVYSYSEAGDCDNQADSPASGTSTYDKISFRPSGTWIPSLSTYLSPFPVEKRYSAPPSWSDDMLLNKDVRTYAYRHLIGGFMVYGRMENPITGDSNFQNPLSGDPKPGSGNFPSITSDSNLYIIRQ